MIGRYARPDNVVRDGDTVTVNGEVGNTTPGKRYVVRKPPASRSHFILDGDDGREVWVWFSRLTKVIDAELAAAADERGADQMEREQWETER